MPFSYFFEQILSGIVIGASYALVGAGISMMWGTLKMVNIAQGELYMLGAYFLWLSITVGKVPVLPAILIAVVGVLLVSAFIQISTIRPLMRKEGWDMSPYILTMGISIFLQNFALKVWGERYQNVPYFWEKVVKLFGTISISGQRIIIIVASVMVILVLMLVIKYTKLGRAIRATSQDRQSALMMGINVNSIYFITYIIAGGLAAVAGVLLSPIYSVNPWMGTMVQSKGLVVCILGGLGSVEGAILAGILIGICESMAVTVIGSAWKDVVAYVFLIAMLWLRPQGLFGKKEG